MQITGYGYSAQIDLKSANLLSLKKNGVHVTSNFSNRSSLNLYSGKLLAPWPNRIKEGRYHFNKRNFQLALNDRIENSALHGLIDKTVWKIVHFEKDLLVLCSKLESAIGYPFELEFKIQFKILFEGLKILVITKNISEITCPFGIGFHPYFTSGNKLKINNMKLKIPADMVFDNSMDKNNSIFSKKNARIDFRSGKIIGDTELNHAFRIKNHMQDIDLIDSFKKRKYVRPLQGVSWVHVYSLDFAPPEIARSAIAIEPMSCPPNAFNNKIDLIELSPSDEHVFSFILGMN